MEPFNANTIQRIWLVNGKKFEIQGNNVLTTNVGFVIRTGERTVAVVPQHAIASVELKLSEKEINQLFGFEVQADASDQA